MKITAKTKIIDILNSNKKAAEILFKAGLSCVGCSMIRFENLEQGCKAHGMTKKEIEDLIKKLNQG